MFDFFKPEDILIIDDNKDICTFLKKYIKLKHKLTVREYLNPIKALNDLLQNPYRPKLVFCDFMMPELSGRDLYLEVLKNDIQIPFVFITAMNGQNIYNKEVNIIGKPINTFLVDKFVNHFVLNKVRF